VIILRKIYISKIVLATDMATNHNESKEDSTKRHRCKKFIKELRDGVGNILNVYLGLTILNNILPNPSVEQYVKKNQDNVEQRMAEATCIDMQFNPKVEYGLPDKPGIVDNLSYAVISVGGQYYPEDDTIYMNDNVLTTDKLTARNIFGWLMLGPENSNALPVFAHEQTHSYIERIASEEGVDMGMVIRNHDTTFADRLSAKFVEEGLADYFEARYNGEMPKPISDWSEQAKKMYEGGNFNIFNMTKVYTLGQNLVAPIFDQYGENGIRYLVRNLPKDEELANLSAYQANALEELSQHYPKTVCPITGK
jgi:hypothetical protein